MGGVTMRSSDGVAPRPTLKQIAARAGVHPSTVSRVLRMDEPPEGWSASARRVREIAQDLGYRPNLVAAGLRTNRSYAIGVVIPRLTDGVIAAMCQAIDVAASEAGYQILLATPPDEVEAQLRSVSLLASRQIDGLIVSSLHRETPVMVESIKAHGVPAIAVNRSAEGGLPSVTAADRQGGTLATEHLISLGHRRIGLIAGPPHASTAWERMQGYVAALRRHGVEVDDSLIVHTDFEVQGGVHGAHRLLNLADPPTAIFSINDTAAIGVMGAARDRGLRIPEDLSLVGYNDIPLVSQLPVPFTTISSPAAPMGAVALQQLLRGLSGGEVASMTLPVSLVTRGSTAPPRGPGRE